MISDVLSDAIGKIRENYLCDDWYDELRPEIEVVLERMDALRSYLDSQHPDRQLLRRQLGIQPDEPRALHGKSEQEIEA